MQTRRSLLGCLFDRNNRTSTAISNKFGVWFLKEIPPTQSPVSQEGLSCRGCIVESRGNAHMPAGTLDCSPRTSESPFALRRFLCTDILLLVCPAILTAIFPTPTYLSHILLSHLQESLSHLSPNHRGDNCGMVEKIDSSFNLLFWEKHLVS